MANCFWESEVNVVETCAGLLDFYEVATVPVPGGAGGYGFQVKMGGDEAIVGTYFGDAVVAYRRYGASWINIGHLPASVDMGGGNVEALAISDDGLYAVWGAYASSYNPGGGTPGVAAVFFNNAGVWQQQQLLIPAPINSSRNYGWSTAINDDGTILAVGDPADYFFSGSRVEIWTRSGATWTRVQTLTSPLLPTDDFFGDSVVIHGSYMLVGGRYTSDVDDNQGAVFAYRWTGAAYIHVDTLRPSNNVDNIYFGSYVDMHDNYAIIAAGHLNIYGSYAAVDGYIFARTGDSFIEVLRLDPSNDEASDTNDIFDGGVVAISDDVAILGDIVGVDMIAGPGVNPGKAWVYTRSGGTWAYDYMLEAGDAANPDHFGAGLGLFGDNLLVGARGKNAGDGGLYYFTRLVDPGESVGFVNTVQQADLMASGAAPGVPVEFFSDRVEISGDYVIAAASGIDKAYIFFNNAGTWAEQEELVGGDVIAGDGFGYAVDIDGDYAVVGSPGWNGTPGAAYVFKRTGTAWNETQKLVGSDAANGWESGYGVAISGDTIAFSAIVGEKAGAINSGVAYVFTRSGETWTEQQKIEPSNTGAYGYFGPSVALDDNTLAIGDYTTPNGQVYIYTRTAGVWTERDILTSAAPQTNEWFGEEVCLSGDYLVVGASGYNGAFADEGRIQIWKRNGLQWDWKATLANPVPSLNAGMGFGCSITDNGNKVTSGDANAVDGGRAHIWIKLPGVDTWVLSDSWSGDDTIADDAFGRDSSIHGNFVVVGAWGANGQHGAVYVYELVP